MSITKTIKEAYPRSRNHIAAAFDQEIKALEHLGLTDPRVLPYFIAQCAIESAGFTKLDENLNYTAKRMVSIWPTHFTMEQATACVGDPEAIANRAYGGRMGNDKPGDGYKYRGGGIGMITGKETYARISKWMGVDLQNHPHLVRENPGVAVRAFAAYFAYHKSRGLTAKDHALLGNQDMVSKVVNGGTHGLQKRRDALKHVKLIMGGAALPTIKYRDQGRFVGYAQKLLAKWGVTSGGRDSRFGKATHQAVRQFQRDSKLAEDGVVGPATWAALEKKSRGKKK